MIAAVALSLTASAATELLMGQTAWQNINTNAGREAWNNLESVIITNVNITLAASQSLVTNAVQGSEDDVKILACNDGFYGPDVAGYETGEGVVATNGYIINGESLEYTLVNSSTTNLLLQEFRFDAFDRWKNNDPSVTLEYVSGDLDIADGTVVDVWQAVDLTDRQASWGVYDATNDISMDVTALADTILDAGQSATFRLSGAGNLCVVDNVGLYGEFGVADTANIPPSFNNSPTVTTNGTIDVAYTDTINGTATDPEGDPIGYALVSGPAWLSVAENGDLTGTPAAADLGVNRFTVSATDSNSAPTEVVLEIIVVDPVLEAYDMVGWTGSQRIFADKKTRGNINGVFLDDGARKTAGKPGSTNETWGSIFMTPIAADNGQTLLGKTNETYLVSITNGSIYDIELDGIYFDYFREFNGSPRDVTVAYDSGDLTDAPIEIGGLTDTLKQWYDVDLPFTNLTDKVLHRGEQAVFSVSFGNFSGTADSQLDNLMIRYMTGDVTDVDSDGLGDYWEVNYFGSITNSDGTADFDNDNYIDYNEFVAGTIPTNALSLLVIESMIKGPGANEYVIQWQSANERTYRITSTDNLAIGDWSITNASGIAAMSSNTFKTVTSTLSPAFFRVEVE
jgi:hypothetical protein